MLAAADHTQPGVQPDRPYDPALDSREATERRILANLARSFADAPLDALIFALRQTVERGWGSILEPAPAAPHLRPASHLVEITVFGTLGTGPTIEEAARNWRRVALATVNGKGGE